MTTHNKKKTVDASVLAVAVLGSLVLVNLVGLELFARLDLTRDHAFTLSAATKSTLGALKDPVTITAYFTKDLPPPYSGNARYVKDLLEEYYAHGDGNLRFEFIDPMSEETEEDKEKRKDVKQDIFGRAVREATSMERELQSLGIPPLQVRVNENDKLEVKRAYMGLAVKYGDKKEVIPVVEQTENLEYELTMLVRKLTRAKTPKIALIGGHGGPSAEKGLQRMNALLGHNYELTPVDLNTTPQLPDDVDALMVVGPATPLSDAEQRAIDQAVMSGKSAAFLLDAIQPDLQNLAANEVQHGLTELLASYGIKVEPGLVLDPECASINVLQQMGGMRVQQPVRYPFMPVAKALDAKHPLTRGLGQVGLPFMSALTLSVEATSGVKAESLVTSSPRAWVQASPFNLDPMQRWTIDQAQAQGAKTLLATLSGPVKSRYATDGATAANARILVAGGSSFIQDQFLAKPNETLLLNVLDWLVMDDALLAVRSRGLAAAPLDELTDAKRATLKFFNILGIPFAFVAFGLVRWRMREAKRATATV